MELYLYRRRTIIPSITWGHLRPLVPGDTSCRESISVHPLTSVPGTVEPGKTLSIEVPTGVTHHVELALLYWLGGAAYPESVGFGHAGYSGICCWARRHLVAEVGHGGRQPAVT